MLYDRLAQDLYAEICRIPLIDPLSHIDPRRPTSRTLDDILGHHHYTALAHSTGMEPEAVAAGVEPRERVRALLYHMPYFDNTAQYQWFLEIARAFFDFQGDRLTLTDATWLCDQAERRMARRDWQQNVIRQTNLEQAFVTCNLDDALDGFDTKRFVPCLRADDLVFRLDQPDVVRRLAKATGIEVGDVASIRQALGKLLQQFKQHGAKACMVSLPPDFAPRPATDTDMVQDPRAFAAGVVWMLAEHCRHLDLPFELMIGVSRQVYRGGVPQGQDLFDQRSSLIQYAELFNAFPEVTFPVAVLSSNQNQELVSYSCVFPNVVTFGHWWYSNLPPFIESELRARLQGVPKIEQIGYFSEAHKLELVLPKFNMYRRILATVLADDYVRPRLYSESQALQLARLLLHENVRRIFDV
jgi:glucuronate isomerase